MADSTASPPPAFRQQLIYSLVRDVRIASSSGSSYDPSIRPLCEGRRRPSPNGSRMCAQVVPSEEVDARLAHCRLEPVLVALQRLPLHINKNSPLPTVAHRQLLKCRLRDRVQRNVPCVPILALRDRKEHANEPVKPFWVHESHGAIGPGRKKPFAQEFEQWMQLPA